MVLSDRDIRSALASGDLVIDPLDDDKIQPASVDLILDRDFLRKGAHKPPFNDVVLFDSPRQPNAHIPNVIDLADVADSLAREPMEKVSVESGDWVQIQSGEFILGSTLERVEIPNDLVARVEGKSSLGRLGLLIHATAGYIDPGFKGKITLEIYNLNYRPIRLYPGKSICQLSLIGMTSAAEFPYGHEKVGSRYQNQTNVTGSRYEG